MDSNKSPAGSPTGERHFCEGIRARRKAESDLTEKLPENCARHAHPAFFSQVVHKTARTHMAGKSLKMHGLVNIRMLRTNCCFQFVNKLPIALEIL
jgi:hypothetical protein